MEDNFKSKIIHALKHQHINEPINNQQMSKLEVDLKHLGKNLSKVFMAINNAPNNKINLNNLDLNLNYKFSDEENDHVSMVLKENINVVNEFVPKIREGQYGGGFFDSWLDYIELLLDIGGFIPGAGMFIDITSTIIALIRGNYVEALFSAINIIPVVGSFIGTPGKYIAKFVIYKMARHIEQEQEYNEDNNYDDEDNYDE